MDDMYRDYILDHYKNPRNSGDLPGATNTYHDSNPLCGDEITMALLIDVDVVKDEIPIARLVFPVKLEFRLEGVVLRIHTGRISEILAGDIKVKATLQFGEFVIFEKAFAPISIPGSLLVGRPEAA